MLMKLKKLNIEKKTKIIKNKMKKTRIIFLKKKLKKKKIKKRKKKTKMEGDKNYILKY